ncbi:MAG: helix-turn-helix transcriptional regulator [Acidimicrobiales bacterium]
MANTSSRMLRLLSLLQAQRYWSGGDLAERLGVSLRTLRRDIERLRDLGYPVDAQRGVEGGYQLAPGAALPPLVLDDEEAVALAVGLLSAAQSPVAGTAEASVRALGKVIAVMPTRLRHRVEALRLSTESAAWAPPASSIDVNVLTTLAAACRDLEQLHFDYTAAGGARSERRVEPHRLVSLGRSWYLVAYDLDRHDWRTFRLDRLRAPRASGARFETRDLPSGDATSFVRESIANAPRPFAVDAVVAAPAAAVRARIGQWSSVEEQTEHTCQLQISAESLDWAAFALAVIGADFRIHGPPELVEHLRAWADRFARAIAAGNALG